MFICFGSDVRVGVFFPNQAGQTVPPCLFTIDLLSRKSRCALIQLVKRQGSLTTYPGRVIKNNLVMLVFRAESWQR
jgi:hypothetical protein